MRDGDATGLNGAYHLDVQSHYEHFLETYALSGDENARPGELGLDSLATAELLGTLERAVVQADAHELQEPLNTPRLQPLTISEISSPVLGIHYGSPA